MSKGFICCGGIYEFDGVLFEDTAWSGPQPLKKNGDPALSYSKKFLMAMDKFNKLSREEKKKYRVGGGCRKI
jgi:hypothetical protein